MSDLTELQTAMQSIATNGFATVTVNGQTVNVKSLDELQRFYDKQTANQAATRPGFGVRIQKIKHVYE